MIRRLPAYAFYPIIIAGMIAAFCAGAFQAGLWECVKSDIEAKASIRAIVKYAKPIDAIKALGEL